MAIRENYDDIDFRSAVRDDLQDAGVRILPPSPRQVALPNVLPDMEDEIKAMVGTVTTKADRILANADDCAISDVTKVKCQFVTQAGVILDAVLTLKLDAKPAKVED